jgi:hypothetical protein
MGAYSVPDVVVNEKSETVYSFRELEREKQALEKYRSSIVDGNSELGRLVFDTGE